MYCYYRPQRSCGQGYVFTRVCDSVHRGGLWRTPPGPGRTPQTKENPPRPRGTPQTKENPPGPGRTPWTKENPPGPRRPPPDQGESPGTKENPLPGTRQTPPPRTRENPPPREEDCSIRSTSGRYASYWNAFLFVSEFTS